MSFVSSHSLCSVCVCVCERVIFIHIQWNPGTVGTDKSVLNREVSLIQGLLSTQTQNEREGAIEVL